MCHGKSQRNAGGVTDPNPRLLGHVVFLPGYPGQWRGWGQISPVTLNVMCVFVCVGGGSERGGVRGENLHCHLCFCCHWCLLRPSQSQGQTQIKTVMFRKSITCHTTSSILPFSPFFHWSNWAFKAPSFSPPYIYSLHQDFAINCLPWCECKFTSNF